MTADFGNRKLENEADVFKHNSWDDFEWGEEQITEALQVLEKQSQNLMEEEAKEKYSDEHASGYWNTFYSKNENRFFKERHWLNVEFPEVAERLNNSSDRFNFMEVGCGTGSTVFPYLQENSEKNTFVYALDYSKVAVDLVKANPEYDTNRCKAMVYDLTSDKLPEDIEPESIDIISCIFVLSALDPKTWQQAIDNMYKLLKPGGLVIFRDYGRYDLAQLRFKGKNKLNENFYIRGDGTRAYFFETTEIANIFSKFEILQNIYDRRLTINRSRKLKMYRIWIQGKFQKV